MVELPDIGHLHHVGHVVHDMEAALALYQRLGFTVPPPAYPTMSRREGAPPEPFGAANTHADFARNFVELATYVPDGDISRIPADAELVPLAAPPDMLPVLVERIADTSANLAACLRRFEGLHILLFQSPDIDTAAERLAAAGVGHGGVNSLRRPVETENGTELELVQYLEIDGDQPGARPGSVSEGRVGVATGSQLPRTHVDHSNGAVDLVDVLLCVADSQLDAARREYETYTGRSARWDGDAGAWRLGLEAAGLTVVAESALGYLLPGERAPGLPAFVGYTVAVRDLARTLNLLRDNGFPVHRSVTGDAFVPSKAALGAAVGFRQAEG